MNKIIVIILALFFLVSVGGAVYAAPPLNEATTKQAIQQKQQDVANIQKAIKQVKTRAANEVRKLELMAKGLQLEINELKENLARLQSKDDNKKPEASKKPAPGTTKTKQP